MCVVSFLSVRFPHHHAWSVRVVRYVPPCICNTADVMQIRRFLLSRIRLFPSNAPMSFPDIPRFSSTLLFTTLLYLLVILLVSFLCYLGGGNTAYVIVALYYFDFSFRNYPKYPPVLLLTRLLYNDQNWLRGAKLPAILYYAQQSRTCILFRLPRYFIFYFDI